ncbi:AraC family transcriptional regulator [Ruficoccus amylovorans]|uniref:AraC family transcriptional regulator n=1 Tax=Ruficoccus amylovorans TaxID=1804625 RepID=A0A842HAH5_9BACT|nr:AraC family transcriptional regulator [Ruficoccus amylovorans]MBC2593412.1 AraC family transcriptional regulator [Ruficoccus amylovorans]
MPSAQNFDQDIRRILARLRSGKLRVHIPQRRNLHRKRPNSHFHATPEFFIQTGGATDFDCAGETFRLGTGDVCVMPRGVPHAEIPRDLKTPYGIIVCMNPRDELYLMRARSDVPGRILGYSPLHLGSGRGHHIFHYLDELDNLDALPAPHRKPYTRALLEAFLIATSAELSKPATPAARPGSPLVAQAEAFVRTHVSDPQLNVAGIALTLNCTADHLSRLFHRHRGLTLSTWIAQERVAQARDLLETSTYNISEIGWACGFNEPSYFIRIFRRHVGMTPRQYRLTRSSQ